MKLDVALDLVLRLANVGVTEMQGVSDFPPIDNTKEAVATIRDFFTNNVFDGTSCEVCCQCGTLVDGAVVLPNFAVTTFRVFNLSTGIYHQIMTTTFEDALRKAWKRGRNPQDTPPAIEYGKHAAVCGNHSIIYLSERAQPDHQ